MSAEQAQKWGDKPYHSLDYALKKEFGGKVYKLSLSSGCSCPNRDGSIGYGGCIFCSEGGSGDFAEVPSKPVSEQIEGAKARVFGKLSKHFAGYLAYFQSFSNTYGSTERLIPLFEETLSQPEILGLSIGTRPDCLSDEMIKQLAELNQKKPIWIELGLQTIHEDSARRIRRGYALPVFEDAFRRLKKAGLRVVVHVIIGLPGEAENKTRETVRYLAALSDETGAGVDGIKLHLLHIMKGTALGAQFWQAQKAVLEEMQQIRTNVQAEGKTVSSVAELRARLDALPKRQKEAVIKEAYGRCELCYYDLEAYAVFLASLIELLPETMVIHRITGDAPKRLLLAPLWTADKKRVMNTITKYFREHSICQGSKFELP